MSQRPGRSGAARGGAELRLHDNEIEKLPAEFAAMTALRRLWLNRNRLARCPDELGRLAALETLALSDNPFTELCLGVGCGPD